MTGADADHYDWHMTTTVYRVEVDEPGIHIGTATILANVKKGFFTAFHEKRWEIFDYNYCDCEDEGENPCDECVEYEEHSRIIGLVLSPPSPYDDCHGHCIRTDQVCVFTSMDQLSRWFTDEVIDWAKRFFGAQVAAYDLAENAGLITGQWQAICSQHNLSNRRVIA